jgi:hypothetical protein
MSRAKFSMRRPKNCSWLGRRGRHNVCVCGIHENFKLMAEVLHIPLSIEQLCTKVLCEDVTDDCFMGFCDECPKMGEVDAVFDGMEESEEVEFMQWSSTDSTSLIKHLCSFDDFKSVLKLRP